LPRRFTHLYPQVAAVFGKPHLNPVGVALEQWHHHIWPEKDMGSNAQCTIAHMSDPARTRSPNAFLKARRDDPPHTWVQPVGQSEGAPVLVGHQPTAEGTGKHP
jgi:hypothetical protein